MRIRSKDAPFPEPSPGHPVREDVATGDSKERSLSRAILARYLAELFAEPNGEWRSRLNSDDTRRDVSRAVETLGLPLGGAVPIPAPDARELLEDRNRLFGHTVRSTCPPYELEYGRGEVFQQSQSLADLAGFYAAFGYQATGPLAERPDHVVAQWEFLSILALKESMALHEGAAEAADCCRDAQRKFLLDHAAAWMPAFLGRMRKAAPSEFYTRATELADVLLMLWCNALAVSMGPAWLELRPIENDDTTISCGADADVPCVELGPTLAAALGARS